MASDVQFSMRMVLVLIIVLQCLRFTSENSEVQSRCMVDLVDGHCPCCASGWQRSKRGVCETECIYCRYNFGNQKCVPFCEDGRYGELCHLTCSETCSRGNLGQPVCTMDYGRCNSGCLQGYYGDTCLDKCSLTCKGESCYQDNGTCVDCISNRSGPKCEKTCEQCVHGKCKRDGFCACETQWCGETCEKKCHDEDKHNVSAKGSTVADEHDDGSTSDKSSTKNPEVNQIEGSSYFIRKLYNLLMSVAGMMTAEVILQTLMSGLLIVIIIQQKIGKAHDQSWRRRHRKNKPKYKEVNQAANDSTDTEDEEPKDDIDLIVAKSNQKGKRNIDEARIPRGSIGEAHGIENTSSNSTVVDMGPNANPVAGEDMDKFEVVMDGSGLAQFHKEAVKPPDKDLH